MYKNQKLSYEDKVHIAKDANKRDKNGNANHRFERCCREHNIELIFCKYNHPQSNGKIERFFQIYAKHRHAFRTKDEFLHTDEGFAIENHMMVNFSRNNNIFVLHIL